MRGLRGSLIASARRHFMRTTIALLFAVITAATCWAQPAFDPVTSDPPTTDAQFPPTLTAFSNQSGGGAINARGLLAQGKGPHPTVLMMHGFPGNELIMDLAQAMRRAGWNVFMFHYRGNWSSGGVYDPNNVIEDTSAMLAYLRAKGADPASRIDASHIVLIGHSVGGFAALNTAAADAQVKSVASISG